MARNTFAAAPRSPTAPNATAARAAKCATASRSASRNADACSAATSAARPLEPLLRVRTRRTTPRRRRRCRRCRRPLRYARSPARASHAAVPLAPRGRAHRWPMRKPEDRCDCCIHAPRLCGRAALRRRSIASKCTPGSPPGRNDGSAYVRHTSTGCCRRGRCRVGPSVYD